MNIKIKHESIYSLQHAVKKVLKSMLCRVAVFSVVASVGIMSAQAQSASNYPTKPIRLIVPVAAGGNVDLVARAVAEPLSKALGQQVIVENRPGASSLVGTMMVANAPADGYTLLAHSTTFVTAPLLLANAGYDPLKNFIPITLTCEIPMVMVINQEALPAKNMAEVVKLAKANPKKYAYASSGNGSTGHIAAELFSNAAGVSLLHVPYKGNAQSVIDVIAGQVPIMFDQVSTAAKHIESGKLYPIAVTSMTRSSILPKVPTLDESGLKGFNDSTFNGIFAPIGTPPAIVNKLHAEISKILKTPSMIEVFKSKGVEMIASPSPAAFSDYIRNQTKVYGELVKNAGITTN